MYEVEVKVPADHDAVRQQLADLDATELGTVTQIDTYYDAPHRNFAETDEALRIRRESPADGVETGDERVNVDEKEEEENETVVLTYKGPLVEAGSKTRSEAESRVSDENSLREILRAIGFEPSATVEKKRERFRVDDAVVSLDYVTDVGTYVEVEYPGSVETEDEVDQARKRLFEVLRELALDPDDQVRTSYLGLKLHGARDRDPGLS